MVAGAGRDTRAELEYLDTLQAQVMQIAVGAQSLSDAAGRLYSIDRVEFVAVTDSLRADLATGIQMTQVGPPSKSLVAVNALYRQALVAWNRGVTGFASGILVAADDPSDSVVDENIADALAELRAGDELYRQLVLVFDAADVPSPLAPMPVVVLSPVEGGLVSTSRTYVAAARSRSNTLMLRPGLGIAQLLSDPQWVVNPDGQTVMPATSQAIFSVVVRNAGNVVSRPETLSLTLTGGADPLELAANVDALEPGRQRTIVFQPIAVESSLIYEVSAILRVVNPDSSLDDNEISVVFVVNEAATPG